MMATPAIRIEDVLAFNERLLFLANAGIPVHFEPNPSDIEGWTQWINSQFAVRSGRGETIEAILKSEPQLSPQYRDALTAWVVLGGSMSAAEPLVSAGRWRESTLSKVGLTLSKLWIVWLLASMSLLYMIWNLTPKLSGLYDVSHLEYRPGMRFLMLIYSQLPWWITACVVIGLAIPLFAKWQSRHALFRWLPKRSKVLGSLRRSEAAHTASLLARNEQGYSPTQIALEDSPLTEWAMTEQDDRGNQAASLEIVSELYRSESDRTSRLLQDWIPSSIGLLLGALIVLGLGLALFWPMVELLIALCEPPRINRD